MEKFTSILKQINEICIARGFKKDGLTFRLQSNNTAIINLQKSRDFIEGGIKFTINIGLHFAKLRYFNSCESLKKPSFIDCQWKVRLGKLFEKPLDFWWIITNETDLDSVKTQLNIFFEKLVFPEIEKRQADKDFIEMLFNEDVKGITEIERLNHLCSFFCIYDDDRLQIALDEFKIVCNMDNLGYLYESKLSQIEIWKSKKDVQNTWSFQNNSYQWR